MTDTAALPGAYDDLELSPILTAALIELRDHGYHGTTVRRIVQRAGLTMPALYYHYGNKEGVLVALLHVAMDDLMSDLDDGVDDAAAASAGTRLRQLVRITVHHVTTRQALAALHREYQFLGTEERSRYIRRRTAVDRRLAAILADGVRTGEFRIDDPEFARLAILGMLQGIADWYHRGGPDTPDVISDRYERLAVRLVGA